jgi:glycosyltransferase involved in cell wall biosynthesis
MNKTTTPPIVSVSVVAYNHERYIAQTLDSILEQQTNFPFEIVIGEDASTDGTLAICRAYAKKHPHIIRILDTPKNVGSVPNFIRTLAACRGRYIAHLDGDDYWIDRYKLQKQVERMRQDPELTLCFTSRKILFEKTGAMSPPVENVGSNERFYLKDFAQDTYFHASTLMFRKPSGNEWLNNLAHFKIGDRPLSIILLMQQGGYAVCLADVCMVYRMNDNSLFTPTQPLERSLFVADMYRHLKILYPELSRYFNRHLNISDYFVLRHAYRQKDKGVMKEKINQILERQTLIAPKDLVLKAKAALHFLL